MIVYLTSTPFHTSTTHCKTLFNKWFDSKYTFHTKDVIQKYSTSNAIQQTFQHIISHIAIKGSECKVKTRIFILPFWISYKNK